MTDNFSLQSKEYAQYRPVYTKEFFDFLLNEVNCLESAWDCGTGNGQVATVLSRFFEKVYATDISKSQVEKAPMVKNIEYLIETAENSSFENNSFDLITIAQAIHWFDFPKFYKEVERVSKNGAIVAAFGYGLIRIDHEVDKLLDHLYYDTLNEYWDPERKYIDDLYKTIPFPFDEIDTPDFKITAEWTIEHLIGYLSTWSAVQHYIKAKSYNPVEKMYADLKKTWGNTTVKPIFFPIITRIGRIKKPTALLAFRNHFFLR